MTTIYINISFVNNGGKYELTTPKSEHSKRVIAIPNTLFKMLMEHKGNQNRNNYIFACNGSVPPKSTITRKFNKYIESSGVREIRLHDLRHSHATMLINEIDAKPHCVMKRLGHSDVSIPNNTYAN